MSKVKSTLTAERLRELLHYDPETGVFTRLVATVRGARFAAGTVAGSVHSQGYRTICIDGRSNKCHRLAWLYMTGEWPADMVDHANGIKSDNRWANLRSADRALNMQNLRKAQTNSRSGLLGVCIERKGKFRAEIRFDGKRLHLGTHETAEAAHAAYLEAKREFHLGNTI